MSFEMEKKFYSKPLTDILELRENISILAGTTDQDDYADAKYTEFDSADSDYDDSDVMKSSLWE